MDVFLMQKSSSILSQTSLNALFVNIPLNTPYYTKLHVPVCKGNIKTLTSNQFSVFIIFNKDRIYILSAYSVADAEWSKQTPLCARYTVCRCCSITNLCCSIPKRSLSLSSVFLFPLKVFASRFLVFGSRCQIPFHQRKSDVLSLQGEFLLGRVPRVVMLIINGKKIHLEEPLYSIKYFVLFC